MDSRIDAGMTYRLQGAVDLHSHTLPGIDDGAITMADSLEMLRIAAENGTAIMTATPHRWHEGHENGPELLRRLTAQVNEALSASTLARVIQLLPGQEIPLLPSTAAELMDGTLLTLGDYGKYALVEPPFEHLPDFVASALSEIASTGICPVLAHPERNAVIQRDPSLVEPFLEAGAVLQLTAMSVSGDNGPVAEAAAHWIIEKTSRCIVASDTHSATWRPPLLTRAFAAVTARHGAETANRLFVANPGAIVRGDNVP